MWVAVGLRLVPGVLVGCQMLVSAAASDEKSLKYQIRSISIRR